MTDNWKEPYKIRCNNCGKVFDTEEDIPKIIDKMDSERVSGCDDCMTDAYLMNIHEMEQ